MVRADQINAVIEIRFLISTDIADAAREADDISKRLEVIVAFDFNGTSLTAYPKHTRAQNISQIINRYHDRKCNGVST